MVQLWKFLYMRVTATYETFLVKKMLCSLTSIKLNQLKKQMPLISTSLKARQPSRRPRYWNVRQAGPGQRPARAGPGRALRASRWQRRLRRSSRSVPGGIRPPTARARRSVNGHVRSARNQGVLLRMARTVGPKAGTSPIGTLKKRGSGASGQA